MRQPQYVTLAEWAELKFSKVPHPHTLRRWAENGTIVPRPVKMGRRLYVLPGADYVAGGEQPEPAPETPAVAAQPETPLEWLEREWRTLVVTPQQVHADKRPIYDMNGSGVYLVIDRFGVIEYIGESTNLNGRCRRHESNWAPAASAYALQCPDAWRQALEGTYIRALGPRRNTQQPAWITEVPILEAIIEAWKGYAP